MLEKVARNAHRYSSSRLEHFLRIAVQEGMYTNSNRLRTHLNYMFYDIPLHGKRVLDIGGGKGILSFYASMCGAEAICLEPEFDGSSEGMINAFQTFKRKLSDEEGTSRIEVNTFQNYDDQSPFDVIILGNSINHLNEQACMELQNDMASRKCYIGYFQKMFEMLKPGGVVVLTDCSRSNFFNNLGVKSPFMPTIEWKKHQSPELWSLLMREVGLEFVELSWTSPNCLGKQGRILFSNRLVAYFLFSHFRLVCRKPIE